MTLITELRKWDGQEAICPCPELMKRAAEYIEEILLKDRGKTREINLLTQENRNLRMALRRIIAGQTDLETAEDQVRWMWSVANNAIASASSSATNPGDLGNEQV